MCSKIGKLSAGQSAGIGFGIDAGVGLLNFFTGQKETNRENEAIKRRNQLAINVYETKNRNAELAWRNDKTDSDIEVDNKWRETIDAIAESQLKARQTAGASAIAQQQILAKMINASAGREQTGRRAGGRADYLALAQQMAAKGVEATFSKDSSILFQDRVGNNLAAFAQGKYGAAVTGANPLMGGLTAAGSMALPWLAGAAVLGKMFKLFNTGGLVGPLGNLSKVKYKTHGGDVTHEYEINMGPLSKGE